MATENRERMTPEEARAVIHLWSRRQWNRPHWPSVADVAEGLDIPVAEAEALLREVRASYLPTPNNTTPNNRGIGGAGIGGSGDPTPTRRFVGAGFPRPSALGSFPPAPPVLGAEGLFVFRLAVGVACLTTFFSLFLNRLLA